MPRARIKAVVYTEPGEHSLGVGRWDTANVFIPDPLGLECKVYVREGGQVIILKKENERENKPAPSVVPGPDRLRGLEVV